MRRLDDVQPGDYVVLTVEGYFIEDDEDVVYLARTRAEATRQTGDGIPVELISSLTRPASQPSRQQ